MTVLGTKSFAGFAFIPETRWRDIDRSIYIHTYTYTHIFLFYFLQVLGGELKQKNKKNLHALLFYSSITILPVMDFSPEIDTSNYIHLMNAPLRTVCASYLISPAPPINLIVLSHRSG